MKLISLNAYFGTVFEPLKELIWREKIMRKPPSRSKAVRWSDGFVPLIRGAAFLVATVAGIAVGDMAAITLPHEPLHFLPPLRAL
ncbi:hypothetical protein HZA87_05910 [Candidatus Uhrbacteria bacterium]|nr:hypothetical protein [Candidatus Uhrbacteria bacterium]